MQFTPASVKNESPEDGRAPSLTEKSLKRRSDVNVRVIEGETVVLDRKGAQIHQLNQTASYIWDRCDGRSTIEEIAGQLAESFAVDPKAAARDAVATVRQLQRLNLLEPREELTVIPQS